MFFFYYDKFLHCSANNFHPETTFKNKPIFYEKNMNSLFILTLAANLVVEAFPHQILNFQSQIGVLQGHFLVQLYPKQ